MAFSPIDALLDAFARNQRINLYLIENLPDEAWRVKAPGGKGRDAASMIGHMHNVRVMWLKQGTKLEGEFSKAEAAAALEESYRALLPVLEAALRGDGRIKG